MNSVLVVQSPSDYGRAIELALIRQADRFAQGVSELTTQWLLAIRLS